jgi:hypothetical protein
MVIRTGFCKDKLQGNKDTAGKSVHFKFLRHRGEESRETGQANEVISQEFLL